MLKDETAWSKFAEGTFHSKNLRTAAAQGLNDLPDRVKANRYALAAANNSTLQIVTNLNLLKN